VRRRFFQQQCHIPPFSNTHHHKHIVQPKAQAYLAATLVGFDLLRIQLDLLALLRCCRLRLHSGLNLTSHGEKGLLNVFRRLGGRLQELNPERIGKFFALFRGNDTLGGQIGLVTDQQLVDVFRGVPVNFVEPLFDIVKGFHVRHIVHHDDTVRTAVVGRGNGSEALLTSGIPNLELDGFLVQFDGANFLKSTQKAKDINRVSAKIHQYTIPAILINIYIQVAFHDL